MDSGLLFMVSVRWLHILAGITWIGILYYFNFVQAWSFPKMEAAARANATQILLPRALLFFRWAALVTFLAGIAMIVYFYTPTYVSGGLPTGRFKLIQIGALLGTIMLINVWGIIWPNQQRLIAANQAALDGSTTPPPDQPKWARRAFLASRTNTMLSIPMVFFMVTASVLGPLAS